MAAVEDFAEELRRIYGMTMELGYALQLGSGVVLSHAMRPPSSLDSTMFFGRGDPNDPKSAHQYSTTLRELVDGFASNGKHAQYVKNMAVVAAYTVWEVVARPAISKEAGGVEVKHPAFADLNKLRQAVVHVGGRLDRQLEVLTFFSKGETVRFTDDQFYELLSALFSALDEISQTYFKRALQAPLDRKLAPAKPQITS